MSTFFLTLKKHAYQLLRWSERHTKTDMIYLTKGGFWLSLSKILSITASFLSSIAFANLLPEETYGTFRYVLSIVSLLVIPTLPGIDSALARAISRGHQVSVGQILHVRMRWGILGAIGSIALGGYYFFMGNEILSTAFFFTAIFIPIMDPLHIYTAVLNGLKKFNTLAQDEIATRMVTTLLLIGVVYYTQNIFIVIAVYFISTTISRYILFRLTLKNTTETVHPDSTDTQEVSSYGKHLTAMNILSQVSVQLDKILLFHYVGGAALAAYYLAFMPLKQLQTMFSAVTTLAFPKFATNSMEKIRTTLPHKIILLYALIIPIVIAYIIAAPYIFFLIYPQYTAAVFISQLLMLQLLFFPLTLISTAFTSQGHKKKLYVSTSAYAAIRIVLLLILVPLFGIYGAVITILLTSTLSNSLLLFLFFRNTR